MNKRTIILAVCMTVFLNAMAQDMPSRSDRPSGMTAPPSGINNQGPMMGGKDKHGQSMFTMRINKDSEISTKLAIAEGNEAKRGIGTEFISSFRGSFIDLASNIIGGVVNIGANQVTKWIRGHKQEWQKINSLENTYTKSLTLADEISNFYSERSTDGPLDPKGLVFNGVTILNIEDGRQTFKAVCHLDKSDSGIASILDHSKFHMVLDTLEMDISKCGLPNDSSSQIKRKDSFFDTRKELDMALTLKLTSSWIAPSTEIFKDVELGEFKFNLSIDSLEAARNNGMYRYYRNENREKSRTNMTGESFIVPRSFVGYRDKEDRYSDMYGLGEYKISASLEFKGVNNPRFENNWKEDWSRIQNNRKELAKQGNKGPSGKQKTKNVFVQYFSKNLNTWTASIIKAPFDATTREIENIMEENILSAYSNRKDQMGGQPGNQPGGQNGNGAPGGNGINNGNQQQGGGQPSDGMQGNQGQPNNEMVNPQNGPVGPQEGNNGPQNGAGGPQGGNPPSM